MGCRSTPLPFLSLTPSPLLLPTRLSDALTLPGNKLPVKTNLSEVSQYYLPFTPWDSFKCGKRFAEALVGKEMTIAFRERWQAAAPLLLGEDAACKWGEKKTEVDFSRIFLPAKFLKWVYVSQLVSNAERSC